MRVGIEPFEIIRIAESYRPGLLGWLGYSSRRWWMSTVLVITDLVALLAATMAAVGITNLMPRGAAVITELRMLSPLLLVFPLTFLLDGLYPAIGLSPVDEIRRLVTRTSLVFIILCIVAVQFDIAQGNGSLLLIAAWTFSLATIVSFRWLVRAIAAYYKLWGEPIAIIGDQESAKRVRRYLKQNPNLGLIPKLLITDVHTLAAKDLFDSKHAHSPTANEIALKQENPPVRTAILALWEIDDEKHQAIIEWSRSKFDRLYLTAAPWTSEALAPFTSDGKVGFEIDNQFSRPFFMMIKRLVDIGLVLVSLPVALPLLGLIAIAVRLDSKGPSFYRQERIGKYGKPFMVWKVRTMTVDADEVLKEYLNQHPELQQEWNANHKLKHDPRVTRLGHFLRKSSLDELPQLWNILIGEMSVIGPRPIVNKEKAYYGNIFHLYTMVRPGLTGLWQVSGRNNTDYPTRVHLDGYYVRNWSIWLDLYILIRTVWVVLRRDGAY